MLYLLSALASRISDGRHREMKLVCKPVIENVLLLFQLFFLCLTSFYREKKKKKKKKKNHFIEATHGSYRFENARVTAS